MMHDLNDLQFFAAVVASNGFSPAARVLGVPKSRISRRVASLEERLDVRLLERSTRRLSLTEVGRQVYEHARAAVAEAEAIEEVVLRMQAEPRGLVRLSCPLGFQNLISREIPGFLAAYPLLRLQLVSTNRRVDLIEEGIDVAIRVRARLDGDSDLQVKQVGPSRRILVASPGLLAERLTPRHPDDLASLPILDQQEQPGPARWTLTRPDGEAVTVEIEPRLASSDFHVLRDAVRQGLGVALLPCADCTPDLTSGALVRVLPDWGVADGILHLVFTSRRGMLPGVRAVIDFAATALRQPMIDCPMWGTISPEHTP